MIFCAHYLFYSYLFMCSLSINSFFGDSQLLSTTCVTQQILLFKINRIPQFLSIPQPSYNHILTSCAVNYEKFSISLYCSTESVFFKKAGHASTLLVCSRIC